MGAEILKRVNMQPGTPQPMDELTAIHAPDQIRTMPDHTAEGGDILLQLLQVQRSYLVGTPRPLHRRFSPKDPPTPPQEATITNAHILQSHRVRDPLSDSKPSAT